MKLSVIVPVYRTEATLDRCIKSIVSQSFTDFELILIDDGSPDHCPLLCDQYAAKDPRITVVHQQNHGLSVARNIGIKRAQGEYLTFIDSDDYIAETTLDDVMSIMGDNDIIEYPIWQHYGSSTQSLLRLEDKVYNSIEDYWILSRAYMHTYACNKIYRRHLFDNVHFPEGKVFEDAYTLPRLLKLSPKVATTSHGCYYYCANEEGITACAGGNELRMLLNAHLTLEMPMDDLYYLHLLNIQLDICRLTDDTPQLPIRKVKPAGELKLKIKAVILNIFGFNVLCKINKTINRLHR